MKRTEITQGIFRVTSRELGLMLGAIVAICGIFPVFGGTTYYSGNGCCGFLRGAQGPCCADRPEGVRVWVSEEVNGGGFKVLDVAEIDGVEWKRAF